MVKSFRTSYDEIVSMENLLLAWEEFIVGKRKKPDVQEFAYDLYGHVTELHEALIDGTYEHGPYQAFRINDPKPRQIHKASVRDRLLHHAIHRKLYPCFAPTFIADSFSCQTDKGMHRALNRFESFARKISQNHTKTCWVLKCDIRKFFASIDHSILNSFLRERISDLHLLRLLHHIIESHSTSQGKGLPLGNLTSQLFANVYMHPLDAFIKHTMRALAYIRYADDFVVLSRDRNLLLALIPLIEGFLHDRLRLELHPSKIHVQTMASGVDFLGWVHFPHHRILRTSTKRRMMRRIVDHPTQETVQSYLGLLKHGSGHRISLEVRNIGWSSFT